MWAPQRARQQGQRGLLLHRCARCSLVNGNERNGRGRSSGRRSLLLVLVGALGEVGALGNSDRGEFFVPGARATATAATAPAGVALTATTARACAACSSRRCNEFAIMAPNLPYFESSLQMMPSDIDMVRSCVCGCVVLCWLFFVPCEQGAPMCVLLHITVQ